MKKGKILLSFLFLLSLFNSLSATNVDEEQKINDIIKQLTIEEKVAFCAGGGMTFQGVERLGIPEMICCDGPRGPNAQIGTTAFPSGILFGSSWNPELVEQAAEVMGNETRALNRGILLAPGCNILRDPLNGRFFEYYTEDPYLNGKIATAHVKGIQKEGVAACIKHFATNNRERNRSFYYSIIDDRTLHEIYLPAFKEVVQAGGVYAVMTSANGINYEYVGDSRKMLTDILKNNWGFDGFVMTDWMQTQSTEKAAFAGLDVSMPGGENCGFGTALLNAVKEKRIPEEIIDDKVRRILRVYNRIGLVDNGKLREGGEISTPKHQQTALKMAEDGIVLLKNDNNILPLDTNKIKQVLVTGPNANKPQCIIAMGGSSWVHSPYEITPLQGIINVLGKDKVVYISSDELGGFKTIPENIIRTNKTDNISGINSRYFVKGNNEPVISRNEKNIDFMWEMKSFDPSVSVDEFREARFDTYIYPPVDGKYTLKFIVGGGSAIVYDDEWEGAPVAIIDPNRDNGIATASLDLKKGVPYHLCIIYTKGSGDAAIRVEMESPESDIMGKKLVQIERAAKRADAVIFVGGIDHSIDTEGRDRSTLDFPASQEKLINHLAKHNKNMNVVLVNGSPLELGGIVDNSKSIIEAWYPGMEGGNAIANIIFGNVNPSGKLPFSWAKTLEEYPSKKLGYEDETCVLYTDSLMVGYRYFDTRNIEPQFPFGYGLSYTSFDFSNLKVEQKNGKVMCKVTVSNTGKMNGAEVAQLYVKPINPSVNRPTHELKAFKKIFLKVGESKEIEFILDDNTFSYYDVKTAKWQKDVCDYVIEVGNSSRNIYLKKEISLN